MRRDRDRASQRERIQRMATTALLGSLALLLSYIETMIPLPFAVPGIKLGLANAAVLVALFSLDARSAASVALVKVLASGFLFGTPTMLAYSAGGTTLALAAMVLCERVLKLGAVPTSMASAICHNAGQLAVAALMLGSNAVFLTLPPLAAAACVTGALIGAVAGGVIESLQVTECKRCHIDLASLKLAAGEHVAFVGANGSGKTTAALQLAGLAEGCSGEARLVFQDPDDQLVNLIAQDDVAFGCENLGIELAEMRQLVAGALADAGASGLALRDVTKLSGGQRQQVAIAGVLAMSPRLVIFDEATSMQDAAGRARFAALVERLKARGVTVVTVTQIPAEAARADRVVVFADCRLAEIVPGSEYAQRFDANEANLADPVMLSEADGVRGVEEFRHTICDTEASLSGPVMLSGVRAAEPKHLAGKPRGIRTDLSGSVMLSGVRSTESKHLAGESHKVGAGISGPVILSEGGEAAEVEESSRENAGLQVAAGQRALCLEGVGYQYPGAVRPVFADVSLVVAPGRIVGLAGPSGSGKSTIAQIAAGYLTPSTGTVSIDVDMATTKGETVASEIRRGRILSDLTSAGSNDSEAVSEPTAPERRHQAAQNFRTKVALVGQSPERALFATTAFEDVMFGARNRGLSEDEAVAAAEEALRNVGIDPQVARGKSPFAFSGGEKRRIALAGMLVLDTPYLILDEPDAGLDLRELARLEALLGKLRAQGKGILLISHNAAFLDDCCDELVELSNSGSLEAISVARPRKVGRWESDSKVDEMLQLSDQGLCDDDLQATLKNAFDLPTLQGFWREVTPESDTAGPFQVNSDAVPAQKPSQVCRLERECQEVQKPQRSDQGFSNSDSESTRLDSSNLHTCEGFCEQEPVDTPGFGVYRPGSTLMHRFNPLVKLVGCVLFMVAGFLASSWAALGLVSLFCLAALAAAKTLLHQAIAALRPFAFLMVFVGVFDVLFTGGGDVWWQAGPVSLSSGGVIFAAQSVLRFALVALGTSTLMRTTSTTQLADACSALLGPLSKLGLHPDNLALSLGMTLRFIPLVQEEFAAVKRAQEARFANFNAPGIAAKLKSYIPVFTPLFASCLRRSSALALAIENRGYGYGAKRTRFRSYPLHAIDGAALVMTAALLAAAIAL